jgi:hypothetical protein
MPPRLFALADDYGGRCACIADGPTDPLQVGGDLMGVADVTLPATVGLELKQVDHHDSFVGGPGSERLELFGRGLQGWAHHKTPSISTAGEAANVSIVAASALRRG